MVLAPTRPPDVSNSHDGLRSVHTFKRHSKPSLSIANALILAHPADVFEVYDDKLWRD